MYKALAEPRLVRRRQLVRVSLTGLGPCALLATNALRGEPGASGENICDALRQIHAVRNRAGRFPVGNLRQGIRVRRPRRLEEFGRRVARWNALHTRLLLVDCSVGLCWRIHHQGCLRTPQGPVDRLAQLHGDIELDGVVAELNAGGLIPHDTVLRNLKLLTENVMPSF